MLFVCSCNVCLKVPQERKVQKSVLFTVILIYCWSWRHCISPGLKKSITKEQKVYSSMAFQIQWLQDGSLKESKMHFILIFCST